jgi:hypothetical protein
MNSRAIQMSRVPVALLYPAAATACAPTLDVAGVYFPDWLVSTVAGLAVAYGVVLCLARYPGARELADSGLFFAGLTIGVALVVWWTCFSRF